MSGKGIPSMEYRKSTLGTVEKEGFLISSPSSSSSRNSRSRSKSPASSCSPEINARKQQSEDSDSNATKDQSAGKFLSLQKQNYPTKQNRSFRQRHSASHSSSESRSLSRERSISPSKEHDIYSKNNSHEPNSTSSKEISRNEKYQLNQVVRGSSDGPKKSPDITSSRRSASSSESEEGLRRKKSTEREIVKKLDTVDDKHRKKDTQTKVVETSKGNSKTRHELKREEERKKLDISEDKRSHRSKRPVSRSRSRSRSTGRHRRKERSPYYDRRRSHSRERYRDRSRSPRRRRSRSRGRGNRSSRRSRSRSYERRHYRRHRSSSRERYRRRRRSHSSSRSRSRSRLSSRERSKGRSGPSSSKVGSLPLSTTAGAMTPQMALQQTMAAMSAKAQALTGIELPKYYNPAAVNPLKYAEQVQKRKLLWQTKDKEKEEQSKSSVWDKLKFAQDQDGKMTAKFRKLMGIKSEGAVDAPEAAAKPEPQPDAAALQKQEELFRNLDQQYEMARMSTHTHRGVGLGYSSQAIFPPLQKP